MKQHTTTFLALVVLIGGIVAVSATPAFADTCTAAVGGSCGAYQDSNIPMSNGYDTYVNNQNVGATSGTTASLSAENAESWSDVVNATPYGYGGIQLFPDTQQLTNDWNPTTKTWGTGSSETPLSALSALTMTYNESSPSDSNSIYEFAPDIWSNYGNDVMFWADTSPARCTGNGLNSSEILGQASFDGQNWTLYRYGGPGAELIFILDGSSSTDPVTSGTCAQQKSGTIDIKAGYEYLAQQGIITTPITFSQMNIGFEVTSADNTTFSLNSYSLTATLSNGSGQQVPAVTSDAASSVTSNGATVTGSVNPEGADTTYKVDYGANTFYGNSVPATAADAGSGTSAVNVSENLTGLQPNTTYHYRIRATNSGGTTDSSDQTFTTGALQLDSIWNNNSGTDSSMFNDGQPVNLGVQFKASENGYITSIKFYKHPNDATTSHQVALWDSNGNELASGTTSNETASGWQEVDFSTPVAITANQTYTASYLSQVYAATSQGLSSGVTNGPLTVAAGGGVYSYGSSQTLPTTSYQNNNYWVDVSFSPQYSIWNDTTTPASASDTTDNNSVNLGVQFKPNQNGYITGVRFYKVSDNTGTHQGALWDSSGNELASGTFTNETSSGWQELDFSTPIAVTAGDTYTASYLTSSGHYAATSGGLASAVGNGVLTALAGGGVYTYGSSLAYPTSTYFNANYWVDVIYAQ